jgi:hypothetical protein
MVRGRVSGSGQTIQWIVLDDERPKHKRRAGKKNLLTLKG